jgi:hypothetical protein
MTIERRRPLPVGRYWIDVFSSKQPSWEAWRETFVSPGDAVVEHTESFEENEGGEARDFVIFRTMKQLVWPDTDMQIPVNTAGTEIQSSADTVQRPDAPKSPLDQISTGFSETLKTMSFVVGGVVVAVGVVALLSVLKRGKR